MLEILYIKYLKHNRPCFVSTVLPQMSISPLSYTLFHSKIEPILSACNLQTLQNSNPVQRQQQVIPLSRNKTIASLSPDERQRLLYSPKYMAAAQRESDGSVFDERVFHLRAEMRLSTLSSGLCFSLQRSCRLLLPIWIPSSSSCSSSSASSSSSLSSCLHDLCTNHPHLPQIYSEFR